MLEEGTEWDEIEKLIQKMRIRDFKVYMETIFLAFGTCPKKFHQQM